MPLASGTQLGPYEILAPLGAGGMGEVYRARDTRLERTVAIKILPEQVSKDPVRKQRFEREAKTISSLNHPNICTLHDIGSQDGVDYLVMECVEGETLAKRLEKGPLPLEQVLKYGAQIADALDKAHRSGVVHRDLKPGNIMLTPTGAKLLDFGLAKPAAPLASLATMTVTKAQSPVTQEGMIVGTFQYMSPEQVEGKEVDGRSDIFSLGAVLYEMLTGQRAFEGKSQLSVASAILEKEPAPLASVKPMTPPALEHAIKKCLAKTPEERWQSASDLASELQWIAEGGSQAGISAAARPQGKARERLAWGTATVFALTAIALATGFFLRAPKAPQAMRLSVDLGTDAKLYNDLGLSLILSPDGTRLAFVARDSNEKRHLYVRALDQLQATVLSGTENAQNPFFSPDGQWLGFFAEAKLKKVSVNGGSAVTLCDAANGRGGSWSEDGTIVFAPDIRSALLKVPSGGGTPEPLTTLDQQTGEATERWPQVLPGGDAVLFTSDTHGANYEDADIIAYSTPSGQRKRILRGAYCARYVPSDHVVYMHEGTLFGVPFNLKRLEVTGPPVPILEGVSARPTDASALFAFSDNGNFVYVPGQSALQLVSIYWMDRQGKFTLLRETPADYYAPAFSPDGKRLAVTINDGQKLDIWVYELSRDTMTRLTFNGNNSYPVWTPDGQRITYVSSEKPGGDGGSDLCWTRADGTGDTQRLTDTKNQKFPRSWHPNGKLLAFDQLISGTNFNVSTISVDGNEKLGWKPGETNLLWPSAFREGRPSFSPDGHWLAYESFSNGSLEVYVRSFQDLGGKWQISAGGGRMPMWSRDGKELFYRTPDNRIMVVTYTVSAGSFRPDKAQLWSPGQFSERSGSLNFALHPDGKRFAVLKAPATAESAPSKVTFIFNFFEVLSRKFPN